MSEQGMTNPMKNGARRKRGERGFSLPLVAVSAFVLME